MQFITKRISYREITIRLSTSTSRHRPRKLGLDNTSLRRRTGAASHFMLNKKLEGFMPYTITVFSSETEAILYICGASDRWKMRGKLYYREQSIMDEIQVFSGTQESLVVTWNMLTALTRREKSGERIYMFTRGFSNIAPNYTAPV